MTPNWDQLQEYLTVALSAVGMHVADEKQPSFITVEKDIQTPELMNAVAAYAAGSVTMEIVDGESLRIGDTSVEIFWSDEVQFEDGQIGPGWVLTRVVDVPGVRYRADGSGEPDTVDFVDELVCHPSDLVHLVKQTVKLIASMRIDQHLEGYLENKVYAEMAEAEEYMRTHEETC